MESDEILRKTFGEIVKDLRLQKKLSQEKLALQSDIDRTYLSLLERGLRNPTLKVVFALARTLETKPSHIVGLLENTVTKELS